MTEEEFKIMAQQLRKPEGEGGLKVGKTMNLGNLQMNMQSIKELNTTTNEHILEIGMGNGFFVKDILTPVESVKYTGCDFSQAMIDEASNINKEFINRGQAKFNLANAEELPFKNETFDKVLTVNTLYFWDSITGVFNEIKRVLKPGGELVITIRPKEEMDNYPITKYGFKTFNKPDLTTLLVENGFKIINAFEREEAEREFAGIKMKDKFIIVRASKTAVT